MTRVFLDSSVLFSDCYSPTGHSRDLILMALRGDIQLVSSRYVLEETRRNLARYSPDLILFLNFVIETVQFELVRPTKAQVLQAAKHVTPKDAPIVSAAMHAKVDMLVSVDKKHLLGKPELAKFIGAKILTPKQAFTKLRAD